jgi:nucleoside-diphosphate-sugar epimerase
MDFLPARESDPPSNVLDIALAKAELGWDIRTTLREGLEKSIAWNMDRLGL